MAAVHAGAARRVLMLWLILQLLLVAWVPGALLLRLPGRSRAARAALPADERLFWTVLLSVVWSTTLVLLLGAVSRYSFDRLLTINAVAAAVVLIGARQHIRLPRPVSRPGLSLAVPVGIVALGLWLYFPQAEYVVGGRDPGAYINEGIQIAQRGQLVVTDPLVSSVPPTFRDLFFRSHDNPFYYGLRFVGFFVQDPDSGQVVGQFPHFFPASIAIGYGLNGLSGARQASAVWAILGLLSVYFLGARLFGRSAAAVAAGLLAINVVTVWFARYPNAELVMQAMLFAALLAFSRGQDEPQWFFPSVAGALLGLMLFLRYDAVLPIAAGLLAVMLTSATGTRPGRGFIAALVITAVPGFWYLLDPMRAYSAYPFAFTRANGGWIVAAAGLLAWWIVPRVLARPAPARITRLAIPFGLAAVLVICAVYAWFFRQEGGRTAIHDAVALRTYGWYVTGWMIGAAVASAAWFATRAFWRAPAFHLTFAVFALFFFYKTRIVPEHFWASRRFLPMALPSTMLLVAALVSHAIGPRGLPRLMALMRRAPEEAAGSPRRWQQMAGAILLVAVLAPVAVSYWRASAPVRHHVEYAGLIPRLEALAGRIGDRDLLIVESRDAGSDLHVLAMPLAYIYARQVLVLESAVPSKPMIEGFLTWARPRYDTIWFLGGGGTDLLTARVAAEPVAAEAFGVPEYDAPTNAYPQGVRRKDFEYGLYRVTLSEPKPRGPVRLDIGSEDDLNVVRFHARERGPADAGPFRWTGPQSYVLLQGVAPEARTLTLWLSAGGRPAQAPPAVVEVTLADRVVGTAQVSGEWQSYSFAIPPELASTLAAQSDPARLILRVATWNPAAILGGTDTRELGVMVSRVEVQ